MQYTSVPTYWYGPNAESTQNRCYASNTSECRCIPKDAAGLHGAACIQQNINDAVTNIYTVCGLLADFDVAAGPFDADQLEQDEKVGI